MQALEKKRGELEAQLKTAAKMRIIARVNDHTVIQTGQDEGDITRYALEAERIVITTTVELEGTETRSALQPSLDFETGRVGQDTDRRGDAV